MWKKTLLICCCCLFGWSAALAQTKDTTPKKISEVIADCEAMPGFFNLYWNETTGKLYLEIDRWDTEFLYVNSLTGGIGSNDIGLDRNQLGNDRVVKFVRTGPKVLLMQPNYRYRAVSDNQDEVNSVRDAFAQSVLWGFTAAAMEDDRVLIDLTDFLLQDAHQVASRLKQSEGTFKVDPKRSMLNMERTKNFPKNTEMDALITLTGEAKGRNIRSVTPSSNSVTVSQHHSFVELPDDNYEPREFDPRCGFYPFSYYDYATPIDQPLVKRFITRHRLEKKDPSAAVSEAVEPIIYYLDRGAPEPIKSALIEGGKWWNQAFEAAGYRNAFQVMVLPEDADPMDVRYNVINWTHRSTRGWSYGSSVTDPRTGEIIKGHVLLGSLRVRQDFLIAQGLVAAYENGEEADPRLLEMALARLRQLSAHEIGHTIGLTHNFAASYDDRASVMDYPHPYIRIDAEGEINFDQAYDTDIGEWDKRTIIYGYSDFPEGTDEHEALQNILQENETAGFKFISDSDARPAFGAHPYAHLWDNGQSPIEELRRLNLLRRKAIINFSEKNIPVGAPMSTLEDVFVPVYLMHRYQVEAVSKVIGGVEYEYAVRGAERAPSVSILPDDMQRAALEELLGTLSPSYLAIPRSVMEFISPPAFGYQRGRENFNIHTGVTFDPLAAAEAAADHTLSFLLNPQRLARLIEHATRQPYSLSAFELIRAIRREVRRNLNGSGNDYEKAIAMVVEKRFVYHLLRLAADESIQPQVAALALSALSDMNLNDDINNNIERAHRRYLALQIEQFRRNPEQFEVPAAPKLPDGSPIGCGE